MCFVGFDIRVTKNDNGLGFEAVNELYPASFRAGLLLATAGFHKLLFLKC